MKAAVLREESAAEAFHTPEKILRSPVVRNTFAAGFSPSKVFSERVAHVSLFRFEGVDF